MKQKIQNNAPASAVYGLGFIGAAVYFIFHATSIWMGSTWILKGDCLACGSCI